MAEDELDVTDITESWDSSPHIRDMQKMLAADLNGLEEIIGDEFTYDDLESVTRQKSVIIFEILRRLLNLIKAFSKEPTEGEELHPIIIQLKEGFKHIKEKATEKNGGETPKWIVAAEAIFNFAAMVANSIDIQAASVMVDIFMGGGSGGFEWGGGTMTGLLF